MTSPSLSLARPGGLDRTDMGLYALVLLGWGTSWIAIPAQLGVVAPEVSIAYRFAIGAAIMFVWLLATGRPSRFAVADHARFALMGVLMFSTNFALFYYAGFHLASGLLAIIFATATLFNILFSRLFFGDPVSLRTGLAAVIGLSGLVLVFWPELAGARFGAGAAWALVGAILGVVLFSLGNMVSRTNQSRGLPVLSANAWAMFYGCAWMVLVSLAQGHAFAWDWRPQYVAALSFHAVFSTVLAFGAYMTLLGRIGPQRAGYATVVFPIIALLISTVFEGYRWTPFAIIGLALVLAGNVLILTASRKPPAEPA